MSQWADTVDAWIAELQTIPALASAVVHRYASWSQEQLIASNGERHLAVWPQSEPEVVEGYVAAGMPSDLATQAYTVAIWEGAGDEGTRRFDDDDANRAWLDLHEAVRARFYLLANSQLSSSSIMDTHYTGSAFDFAGGVRQMAVTFAVRIERSFT